MIQQNKSTIFESLEDFVSSSLQSHEDVLIHLRYNEISKNGAQILGEGLANCPFLTKLILYLSYNTIESHGAIFLGQSLVKCINLKNLVLWIYGNEVNEEDSHRLKLKLKKIKRLVKLFY
ncbi:hypothetical protein ABPG74_013210 [Tetrahymena malaccensis]